MDPLTLALGLGGVAGAGVAGVVLLGRVLERARSGEGLLAGVQRRLEQAHRDHVAGHRAVVEPQLAALGLPLTGASHPREPTLTAEGPDPRHPAVTLRWSLQTRNAAPGVWAARADGRADWAQYSGNDLSKLTIRLEARAPHPLPEGLMVRRETEGSHALRYLGVQDGSTGDAALDDLAHIQGEGPDTEALVRDPEVAAALAVALRAAPVRWTPAGLTATLNLLHDTHVTPERSARMLLAMGDLAAAAAACQRRPWAALADDLGLTLDRSTGRRLTGALGGVPVEADLGFRRGVARLALPDGLGGLRVGAADPGPPGEPVAPPNPVLGAALKARAADASRARAVLSDDAVMEAAIALLRGRPGSAWAADHLSVPLTPDAAGRAALDEALALARALGAV